MVYATMIIGEEYCRRYSQQVLQSSFKNTLYILTDYPELFPNCNTIPYTKAVFSYYDKLIFLAELTLEKKQRVTFIDCDWLSNINSNTSLEEGIFYTYWIYSTTKLKTTVLFEFGVNLMKEVLQDNGYKVDYDDYIGEAVLSLPYCDKVTDILKDLKNLQKPWEKAFSQSIKTNHSTLLRYANYGVGYAEGGALTAILRKYSVPYKSLSKWEFIKKSII